MNKLFVADEKIADVHISMSLWVGKLRNVDMRKKARFMQIEKWDVLGG
jgi:hypothetical protein